MGITKKKCLMCTMCDINCDYQAPIAMSNVHAILGASHPVGLEGLQLLALLSTSLSSYKEAVRYA